MTLLPRPTLRRSLSPCRRSETCKCRTEQALFIRKLSLCCYTFDFTDPMKNVKEKEVKRQTLLELVDYVNSGTGKFNEAVFEDITRMLVANLFRTLPPSGHEFRLRDLRP